MSLRPATLAGALAAITLIGACSDRLEILGPTPAGEGITIYIHANSAGSSQSINVDVHDLDRVEGPCARGEDGGPPTWSDCISSVQIAPGWTATFYEDRDYKGRSVALSADVMDLRTLAGPCDGNFNDCVSSIRVSRR